ncbi:MAG: hypothetical protein AAGJ36_11470, partial [Pseudomonadota bacterium]
ATMQSSASGDGAIARSPIQISQTFNGNADPDRVRIATREGVEEALAMNDELDRDWGRLSDRNYPQRRSDIYS